MRLRTRLVLIVALAAVLPIALLGVLAGQLAGDEIETRVNDAQGRDAEGLALYAGTWLDAQVELLALQVGSVPVEALPDDARTRFLRLVYQQTAAAHIVTLTDRARVDRAPPARLRAPQDGAEAVDDARLAQFKKALPLDALAAVPDGVTPGPVLGRPYRPAGRDAAVVPVAVPVPGSELVVGVELGLDPIAERLGRAAQGDALGAILDATGTPFASGEGELSADDALRPLLSTTAVDVRFLDPGGVELRAATAPVPGTDWTIVVAEPASAGDEAVRAIQARTIFLAAVAAVLAVVMGSLWAGQLAAPVRRLQKAALEVAEGDLGRRVDPDGGVELEELGRAFNFMSTRLQRNAAEIRTQRAEIEAWNQELQTRVDDQTRELRDAQERLLQSARLAAVGEMGAGLAHELNNPLAGILGLCQVLIQRDPGGPAAAMLVSMEREARRCRDIVATLLGFSQEVQAADEGAEAGVVALAELADEVLALVGPPLRQRGIQVEQVIAGGVRIRGSRAVLGQALAQLLTSVRAASSGSATLRLTDAADADAGEVVLAITLTGEALALGGDDWRAAGLGLWAARRTLDEQGGRLVEPMADGPARTLAWRVVLPAA